MLIVEPMRGWLPADPLSTFTAVTDYINSDCPKAHPSIMPICQPHLTMLFLLAATFRLIQSAIFFVLSVALGLIGWELFRADEMPEPTRKVPSSAQPYITNLELSLCRRDPEEWSLPPSAPQGTYTMDIRLWSSRPRTCKRIRGTPEPAFDTYGFNGPENTHAPTILCTPGDAPHIVINPAPHRTAQELAELEQPTALPQMLIERRRCKSYACRKQHIVILDLAHSTLSVPVTCFNQKQRDAYAAQTAGRANRRFEGVLMPISFQMLFDLLKEEQEEQERSRGDQLAVQLAGSPRRTIQVERPLFVPNWI